MRGNQRRFIPPVCAALLIVTNVYWLPLTHAEKAPPPEIIEAGTVIAVRTADDIRGSVSDGRIFSGIVEQPVRDTRKNVTLPRGTDVELVLRSVSSREYTLDLESVTANGSRMSVQTEPGGADAEKKDESPTNGALVGVIIGALSWGGDGAEIVGAPGTMPRRDVQLVTRGRTVKLPAGTLVVFRLGKPLRAGVPDAGFSRNGRHFHAGYGTNAANTKAYEAGLQAGRQDRQRKGTFNQRSQVWNTDDLLDYQAGYRKGFDETPMRVDSPNTIQIGADNYIRWKGPPDSQVYVRVDGQRRLFSVGESGPQPAPWIKHGHKYVFTLVDGSGKEIARDENDLRVIPTQ